MSDTPPKVTTIHGGDPAQVRAKQQLEGNVGQHSDYIVLSAEQCAKGFVRPVRLAYRHLTCGSETRMGLALAETYAREPGFYGFTFCCRCNAHYPVGAEGEFVWSGEQIKVGT